MRVRPGFLWLLTFAFAALLTVAVLFSPAGFAEEDDDDRIDPADTATCLECHSDGMNTQALEKSAHGKLNCQQCHAGVDRYPHPEEAIARKPACATCHGDESAKLAKSAHAKPGAPGKKPLNCTTCHGTVGHEVPKMSAKPAAQRMDQCKQCHQQQFTQLARSRHGGSAKGAKGQLPTCYSCHGGGPHDVTTKKKHDGANWEAACHQCHGGIADAVHGSAHGAYARKNGKEIGCFSCHGSNPHTIADPARANGAKKDGQCRQCHGDVAKLLATSAHAGTGNHAGKDVSCLECHGSSPHQINPSKHLTALEKSARCESCHQDSMQRLVDGAHGPRTTELQSKRHFNCLTCHGGSQHAVTPPAKVTPLQKVESCKECHQEEAKTLAASVHGGQAKSDKSQPTCTSCHAANPKDVTVISKMSRREVEASCRECHADLTKSHLEDVHARPDKQPGDHPSCLDCHGGMAHGIKEPRKLTAREKVEVCAKCHNDTDRMKRYGLYTDTVPAYEATLHGKAVMRLRHEDAATCVDCHGLHGILPNAHPDSPTQPRHMAEVCAGCHKGNTMDFAFSYASHFRLGVEQSVISPIEKAFIGMMAGGAVFGLLGMVLLGFRRPALIGNPQASRRWGYLINVYSLLAAMLAVTVLLTSWSMVLLGGEGWRWPAYVAGGLLAVALLALLIKRLVIPRGSTTE